MGLLLLEDDGNCPLCDSAWPPGKLKEYLEKKNNEVQAAVRYQIKASELTSRLAERIAPIKLSIQKLYAAAHLGGIKEEEVVFLNQWINNLNILSDSLLSVFDKYPLPIFDLRVTQQLIAPVDLENKIEKIYKIIKQKYPETTPEQTAWDTLTRLEENLKFLEKFRSDLEKVNLSYIRASTLEYEFEQSRDFILQKLYDEIRDRFVDLYKQLHGEDEKGFQANLKPDGAALNFEVDFYGRGPHPPHALHSEGHQDSMGLCLYLALAERLTGGFIDMTILDDVVMSVDSDHRRELCHLISTAFPDRQFLITTHDKAWANRITNRECCED